MTQLAITLSVNSIYFCLKISLIQKSVETLVNFSYKG